MSESQCVSDFLVRLLDQVCVCERENVIARVSESVSVSESQCVGDFLIRLFDQVCVCVREKM